MKEFILYSTDYKDYNLDNISKLYNKDSAMSDLTGSDFFINSQTSDLSKHFANNLVQAVRVVLSTKSDLHENNPLNLCDSFFRDFLTSKTKDIQDKLLSEITYPVSNDLLIIDTASKDYFFSTIKKKEIDISVLRSIFSSHTNFMESDATIIVDKNGDLSFLRKDSRIIIKELKNLDESQREFLNYSLEKGKHDQSIEIEEFISSVAPFTKALGISFKKELFTSLLLISEDNKTNLSEDEEQILNDNLKSVEDSLKQLEHYVKENEEQEEENLGLVD